MSMQKLNSKKRSEPLIERDVNNIKNSLAKGKRNYKKVELDLREKLINLVNINGLTIKSASYQLDINYSTAKNILKMFKFKKQVRNYKKNDITQNEVIEPTVRIREEETPDCIDRKSVV